LVEEDVAAALSRRVAKVLGDVGLLDGVDVVIIENDPSRAALNDGDVVTVVRSAARRRTT
jgi:NACalpha-BTF3-like transcription factor